MRSGDELPDLAERQSQANIGFIKTEFEWSLMFLDIARSELGLGDQSDANRALEKAEIAYDTIIEFLPGVTDLEIRNEIRREALELRYELDEVQGRVQPQSDRRPTPFLWQ